MPNFDDLKSAFGNLLLKQPQPIEKTAVLERFAEISLDSVVDYLLKASPATLRYINNERCLQPQGNHQAGADDYRAATHFLITPQLLQQAKKTRDLAVTIQLPGENVNLRNSNRQAVLDYHKSLGRPIDGAFLVFRNIAEFSGAIKVVQWPGQEEQTQELDDIIKRANSDLLNIAISLSAIDGGSNYISTKDISNAIDDFKNQKFEEPYTFDLSRKVINYVITGKGLKSNPPLDTFKDFAYRKQGMNANLARIVLVLGLASAISLAYYGDQSSGSSQTQQGSRMQEQSLPLPPPIIPTQNIQWQKYLEDHSKVDGYVGLLNCQDRLYIADFMRPRFGADTLVRRVKLDEHDWTSLALALGKQKNRLPQSGTVGDTCAVVTVNSTAYRTAVISNSENLVNILKNSQIDN